MASARGASASTTSARITGIAITGLAIGLGIGLVEVARRQHWLEIMTGGMAGKQFILYSSRTTIGAETEVYPFATLGEIPQDLKFEGERTDLVIGITGDHSTDSSRGRHCGDPVPGRSGGARLDLHQPRPV